MTTLAYRNRLRALLTPAEHRTFARLNTPQKIQTFLDRVPANFCMNGDTAMSPRTMLKAKLAHCAEGAVFAAAALIYHGHPAWLVDIQRYLPTPSLTIWLDIAPETAVGRKSADRDRYERDLALQRRVRESYRRQASEHDWLRLDGERSKDDVAADVFTAVTTRLAQR